MTADIAASLLNVEVEVNARCNRRCWYCPVSFLPPPDTPNFMSDAVFVRIHDELRQLDYAGRISYHLLNEPLVRRDLGRLIALSRAMVPAARQVLFTNGDLLDDERYDELMGAGVDQIVITSHDGTPHPPRPKQIVQYPRHLELTNRGGSIAALPAVTDEVLDLPCHAPEEMLIVTSRGDVLLCYEDSRRAHVYGNVMHHSLDEIWSAPAFAETRRLLREGRRRAAGGICALCTNRAHTRPGRSAASEPFWTDPTALADVGV